MKISKDEARLLEFALDQIKDQLIGQFEENSTDEGNAVAAIESFKYRLGDYMQDKKDLPVMDFKPLFDRFIRKELGI